MECMFKQIHWAWLIFFSSLITTFIYGSVRMSYSILMPEMIVTLKISKSQAGAIASSFFFTYTVLSPLSGFLVDRVNARKLLTLFSIILGASAFLMGKPVSFFQACLFYAMVGVGSSATWTPVMTLNQRWFGARHRGRVLGILSMGWAIGYALMGLILPGLVARYDWRTCWSFLSLLAFAAVPLNAIFIRTKPEDLNLRPWGDEALSGPGNCSPGPRTTVKFRELLRIPDLWWVGISYFLFALSCYLVTTFIVTYGTLEQGFPYAASAKLASAIAFSGMAGSFLVPMLSDFLGRKRCITLNNCFLGASIILIILAGKSWPALLAAVSLFGVFFAAAWPMYAASAGDFFPSGRTGSVLGFWTIFYGIALIIAPLLGGHIADVTGSFTHSFLVAAVAGGLGAFFFSRIKRPVEGRKN